MIKTKDPEHSFDPFKTLWVAVLEQAIVDIQQTEINRLKKRLNTAIVVLSKVRKGGDARTIKQKVKVVAMAKELIGKVETVNRKAKRWLFLDNYEIIDPAAGSFLWICGFLDLDPGKIRTELKRRLL